MQDVADIVLALGTDLDRGLDAEEVARRCPRPVLIVGDRAGRDLGGTA